MLDYDKFDDRSETYWTPYLMYFQRKNYVSPVVNTDTAGFRISHGADGATASPAGSLPDGPVRLLAGASTAFGIGATSDEATLSSRLWSTYAPSRPWVNFAGRSYSSAQELVLFTLYRHLLPEIDEIVIISGFNNMATAMFSESQRQDHGAFFFGGEFFDQMEEAKARHRKAAAGFARRGERKPRPIFDFDPTNPSSEELLRRATDLTVRHLEGWRLIASALGAKISYVLQPMATWVRSTPSPQEKLLFDELDKISKIGAFEALYGQISAMEVGRGYADLLGKACEQRGISFVDLNPILARETTDQDWLYVDRAHFTDHGHDVTARLIAESLNLN